MLQCVAVCCSVLQCVAVCLDSWESEVEFAGERGLPLQISQVCVEVCCKVLQCVAVYCSVVQGVAVCCSVLQYATAERV